MTIRQLTSQSIKDNQDIPVTTLLEMLVNRAFYVKAGEFAFNQSLNKFLERNGLWV